MRGFKGEDMKNVFLGLMCSTVAFAAVGGMSGRSLGGLSKMSGAFCLYVGASAVFSKRDVKITTDMRTQYRASYVYANPGDQTFVGSWGLATPGALAGNDHVGDVVQLAGMPANAVGAWQQSFGRAFAFTGERPSAWLRNAANGAGWVAADVVTDVTDAILERAMFAPMDAALLPDNKAWIPMSDYAAAGHDVTTLNYHTLGLRLEAGAGVRVADTMTLLLILSYRFDRKDKKAKNFREDVFVETRGQDVTFVSASANTSLTGNLIAASFGYNGGRLASGMKVSADVHETFGIMFGVEWRPVQMLALDLRAGVKRYTVDVHYEGGDLAYPGTTGMYTEAFKLVNRRHRLLVTQKDVKRTMTATRWPVVFGGGLRVVFGLHSLHFGMDCTAFEADLTLNKKTGNSGTSSPVTRGVGASDNTATEEGAKGSTRLTNPLTQPTAAQFQDGYGVHQFAATDVVNMLTTKVEVVDLTLSAGYVLSC